MDRVAICEPLTRVESHICIESLRSMSSLCNGFDHTLWKHFARINDLSSLAMAFLKDIVEKESYATEQYYSFLRSMFAKSAKTRHELYYCMLTEAEIDVEFDSIDFQASVTALRRRAGMSMHREHLLIFYSVELFLRAYMELHPRDSPIAGDKLQLFYDHFRTPFPCLASLESMPKMMRYSSLAPAA